MISPTNPIERKDLAALVRRVSQVSGEFRLRSGETSNTYFDKYLFECDPLILEAVCISMKELIPEGTDVLAGLEMGGIPIVTILSNLAGIPSAFIRKERKSYGTCKYAEGSDLNQKNVTIVEDVVSSGGAILDAVEKFRKDDVHCTHAICVIDREAGGADALKEVGVELRSIFTMHELSKA